MKVLVTGAGGFIGSFVCQSLAEQNIAFLKGTHENMDLSDVDLMRKTLEENDVTDIIHLAALADSSDNEKVFSSNIEGLYRLLTAAKASGLNSFVFASTNNVYGEDHEGRIQETCLPQPALKNTYALSKYIGELLVKELLADTDIAYSIMRISDVYGPGQRYGNLIRALVTAVKEDQPIKLYGEGKRTRDYIYVKDVADGLVFACVNRLAGTYNLSTGIGTDVKTLVDIGIKLSNGKCSVEAVPVQCEDDSMIVLDPQKINIAGFKANVSVKDGLRKCVGKENG